ncbi:shikimate dehydrogenase [Virgibacillus siamensis]|uniref:shikimate dehydrogenase n=1 Tax=Virgibacillus siamensis TaxID=480071 RepID=UPI0009849A5C|nr:shikimate dehydrogenase [Virgibacillus siamensis]
MHYQLGLIGYPIQHSLSPWIHRGFLEKANLKGIYSIIEISPEDSFEHAIKRLKGKELTGFNVTLPFKEKIIPYLDDLDHHAESIGAVNTVVIREGKWIGYNTDGKGYMTALQHKFPELCSKPDIRILIIGAGGAARGIYYSLISNGYYCVDIANRTRENAESIVELGTANIRSSILNLGEAQKNIGDYDLIIQTSSIGMKPKADQVIVSADGVRAGSVVSDIIYQPIKTKFLMQAEQAGAHIHFGHTMLLYQAQAAFERWTNKLVPVNEMDQQLQTILEGR